MCSSISIAILINLLTHFSCLSQIPPFQCKIKPEPNTQHPEDSDESLSDDDSQHHRSNLIRRPSYNKIFTEISGPDISGNFPPLTRSRSRSDFRLSTYFSSCFYSLHSFTSASYHSHFHFHSHSLSYLVSCFILCQLHTCKLYSKCCTPSWHRCSFVPARAFPIRPAANSNCLKPSSCNWPSRLQLELFCKQRGAQEIAENYLESTCHRDQSSACSLFFFTLLEIV